MYVCIHIYIHNDKYLHMSIFIYTYIYIHNTYVYMCNYIHI